MAEVTERAVVAVKPEVEAVVASNPVYARVGDAVFNTAHAAVQRGLTPQDIVREIIAQHDIHLNVGELRLLLASRRTQRRE